MPVGAGGNHPSVRPIAGRIKQLPSDWAGSLITSDDPSLAAAVLALLPVGFTWPRTSLCMPVRSYRTLSPLPTQLPGLAVYFLLHLPADRSGLLLATTVPCGVRTFLGPRQPQRVWRFGATRSPGRLIRTVPLYNTAAGALYFRWWATSLTQRTTPISP